VGLVIEADRREESELYRNDTELRPEPHHLSPIRRLARWISSEFF